MSARALLIITSCAALRPVARRQCTSLNAGAVDVVAVGGDAAAAAAAVPPLAQDVPPLVPPFIEDVERFLKEHDVRRPVRNRLGRGGAAAATWPRPCDESRRRRGRDVDALTSRGDAAAATWMR